MSGPKISFYELDSHRKEIIRGQIRCEQQAVQCAQQIQELLHTVLSYGDDIRRQISLTGILVRRNGMQAEKKNTYEGFLEALGTQTDRLKEELSSQMPHISTKYQVSEEALEKKKQELSRLRALKGKAQELLSRTAAVVSDENLSQKELAKQIQRSIAEDLNGCTSFYIGPEDEVPDVSFDDEKAALMRQLEALLRKPGLPDDMVHEIRNGLSALERITQPQYLHAFQSVTARNLFRKVDAYQRECERKRLKFQEAYDRYRILCAQTQEEAKPFGYSDAAVSEVEKETERLELILVGQQERAYISDCVDEVMHDMGYDLIGSRDVVKKRSGKQFKNHLYTLNDGTAVNVTYASDGQISMELGGIAREDRIPNAEETEMLTGDMVRFCGEFAEFERRLQAKGIHVGKRIALSPPSAEYATMINISDYEVVPGTQITEMMSVDRKKKGAEKRAIRRTDTWS